MEVVDAHHHIWSPETHAWLQDKQKEKPQPDKLWFSPVAREYKEDEHVRDLNSAGLKVLKSVYVQAEWHAKGADPVGEAQWVTQVAEQGLAQQPTAFIAYADVNKPGGTLEEQLAQYKRFARFRGIRFMLDYDVERPTLCQTSRGDWMHDKNFLTGMSVLEKEHGLVFDLQLLFTYLHEKLLAAKRKHAMPLQVLPCQLLEAAQFARKFPALRFSLNHTGFPIGNATEEGLLQQWKTGITALASSPNVFCKIGALCNYDEVLGFGCWKEAAVKLYTQHALREFGAHRCMFESNLPVDHLSTKHSGFAGKVQAEISAAKEMLQDPELHQFLVHTAEQVYRI